MAPSRMLQRRMSRRQLAQLRLEPLESRTLLTGDIHTIKHIIIVIQENARSISISAPTRELMAFFRVCKSPIRPPADFNPPYYYHNNINVGGPHGAVDGVNDVNGGKMDGFLRQYFASARFQGVARDVMGFFTPAHSPGVGRYVALRCQANAKGGGCRDFTAPPWQSTHKAGH